MSNIPDQIWKNIVRNVSTVISIQTSLSFTFIVLIIYLIGIGNSFESMVYGHDFVPNESSSFISLMNQLEAEVRPCTN